MDNTVSLRLARHGTWLLLAGLLTGFGLGKFQNHHAGNAAHLTGLIGGFGLIAVSSVWPRLKLGSLWSQIGAWSFIVSMDLTWLGLFLSAALGSASEVASGSAHAGAMLWNMISPWLLLTGAVLSLVATLVTLVGLRTARQSRGAVP